MWQKIKDWFHDSETIFLARLWMLLGLLVEVIGAVDPALLKQALGGINPSMVGLILLVQGVIHEVARRHRDPNLGR